jgi:hypothetical protein
MSSDIALRVVKLHVLPDEANHKHFIDISQ